MSIIIDLEIFIEPKHKINIILGSQMIRKEVITGQLML